MAQALLQRELGDGFRVESAGLAAPPGLPVHPQAAAILAARGLDLPGHASRQVDPAMALAADLILVMDQAQKAGCEALSPSSRGRVFLLGHWQTPALEIADPFRREPEAFARAFEAIQHCVAGWVPHLISKKRSA